MSWKRKAATIAFLGSVMAGTMHIVNRLVNYISTIDNLLYQKEEKYYHWRFGRICYTKYGEGSPILLVHDLNVTSSSFEWENIVQSLSKTNTVYTIDLLGCGRSDKPNLTYTNFLYVQLVTDFIKAIICEKTDVIVTGESATFILMACANDTSVINRVMLVNPQNLVTLAKIPSKRTKILRYLINTPIIGTFFYNIFVNKRSIEKSFYKKYYYDQNKIDERNIITYFESLHKNNSHSKYLYASIKSRYTNANVLCCLKELNNSLFIIVGNADPENALIANQYQNHLPSIEIIGIDETKYIPQMENPKEFLEQIHILFEIE